MENRDKAQDPAPNPDPRPEEPVAPEAGDCCSSGCPYCVYDMYYEAKEEYRAKLKAWEERQA